MGGVEKELVQGVTTRFFSGFWWLTARQFALTPFADANGFVHFNPEANYNGTDAGFEYAMAAVSEGRFFGGVKQKTLTPLIYPVQCSALIAPCACCAVLSKG